MASTRRCPLHLESVVQAGLLPQEALQEDHGCFQWEMMSIQMFARPIPWYQGQPTLPNGPGFTKSRYPKYRLCLRIMTVKWKSQKESQFCESLPLCWDPTPGQFAFCSYFWQLVQRGSLSNQVVHYFPGTEDFVGWSKPWKT